MEFTNNEDQPYLVSDIVFCDHFLYLTISPLKIDQVLVLHLFPETSIVLGIQKALNKYLLTRTLSTFTFASLYRKTFCFP